MYTFQHALSGAVQPECQPACTQCWCVTTVSCRAHSPIRCPPPMHSLQELLRSPHFTCQRVPDVPNIAASSNATMDPKQCHHGPKTTGQQQFLTVAKRCWQQTTCSCWTKKAAARGDARAKCRSAPLSGSQPVQSMVWQKQAIQVTAGAPASAGARRQALLQA